MRLDCKIKNNATNTVYKQSNKNWLKCSCLNYNPVLSTKILPLRLKCGNIYWERRVDLLVEDPKSNMHRFYCELFKENT